MSRYTSIAELTPEVHNFFYDPGGSKLPILWDMELPEGVDAERIRVDISRLRLTHATASIAASFVEGYETPGSEAAAGSANDSETTRISIGSFADPFETTSEMKGSFGTVNLNATYGKPAVTHQVNESLLKVNAEKQIEEGASPEVAWAELYDKAIRQSMREAARKHLIGRTKNLQRNYINYAYGATAALAGTVATSIAGLTSAEVILPTLAYYDVCQIAIGFGTAKQRTRGTETLERRWSLVPFARQPDRYLAVNALSRLPGLVQAAS